MEIKPTSFDDTFSSLRAACQVKKKKDAEMYTIELYSM